jgi:hypothetical protein
MKGQWDVYGTRSCVNAHVRDHQQQCEEQQRCMLRDEKYRGARNTDSTRLSCISNSRATRVPGAYRSTGIRKSMRINVVLQRVNQAVKKICAASLQERLPRLNPTGIERIVSSRFASAEAYSDRFSSAQGRERDKFVARV